jgi:hypothetical protein
LRNERVDHGLRHADGRALRGLALGERPLGKKRKACKVRDVQGNDPRRAGPAANTSQQRRVVGAERLHLGVNIAGLIARARAAAEGCGYRVDFVPACEHRNQRRVRADERHLASDEIAQDNPVELLAKGLEVRANHRCRNAQVRQPDVEAERVQLPCDDLRVTHAIRTVHEGRTDDARPDAVGVARSNGVIHDRGPGRRGTTGGRGVVLAWPQVAPGSQPQNEDRDRDP